MLKTRRCYFLPLRLPPAGIDLDDIGRLFRVFLEDQHRWGITVYVEFLLQVGRFGKALVHIAKLQVVSISKSCQLQREVNAQFCVSEAVNHQWSPT